MALTASDVEAWVESNPEWLQEYVIRKVDMSLINKWLLSHGFHALQDYITGRRGSLECSRESSGQTSPDPRWAEGGFFNDKENRHQRSNSRKHLRHDFARSKMRSIFRTHEPSFSQERETSLAERRSSLKGMRQFLSLPPTSGNILSLLIQSKVRLPRYVSKDEQLKRELLLANEKDFFLEIVKDISHELDLRSLTSRILVNMCILVGADRGSLFFVEGMKGKQCLVSKVFDMCTGTNCIPVRRGDNVVKIPWGQGIIGHVAASGNPLNIINPRQDPRYNDDVDRLIGYTPESLLCMPIRNADDEVIGVAQVLSKNGDEGAFTEEDECVLETYMAFCGMAISNAQAMESYTREYDRNKALLEVVHDLFEEQTSIDNVVRKIMQRAQSLLKCERCVVMLKDQTEPSLEKPGFERVYDLQQPMRNGQSRLRDMMEECLSNKNELRESPKSNQIAEIVASTGETVNITDTHVDCRFDLSKEDFTGIKTRSIICKPIRNASFQTIGVAQLINKLDGSAFDDNDDQLFEAFTIFCGLGINNCMLYSEVSQSVAKQAVALEVLSYHASVTGDDVSTFKHKRIPELREWNLHRLDFNDFSLESDDMVLAGLRIFKESGLIKTFKIDYETLVKWLLTIRKNYRNVAYHNWRHAFNVSHLMFTLLKVVGLDRHLPRLECLALIVACLCHDLDHRGTNNSFQHKSSSALSQLYGTQATLEHHHFNHAVMILNSESHNIFANLTSEDYGQVMKVLKEAIIATDLSIHIQVRRKFFPLVESRQYSWEEPEQRELLRSILMTTCDLGTISKPWDVQRKAAHLVMTEFFDQGDKERTVLKIQPQAIMDRERQDELPKLQMEWIDGICLPLYKCLVTLEPQLQPLLDQVLDNRTRWGILEEQRLSKACIKQTEV